jgi:cationic amino acid transporter 1
MAMARDGLLPPFLCDINRQTLVPVKGTILTGLAAAVLAFSMEVSELAGMVSLLCKIMEHAKINHALMI